MQIHQLPEQQTVADADVFAVDTGQTTRRTPFNALKTIISTYAHQLTNLTETTATSDSDVLPIDDGSGAKKITFENLKNRITEGATPAFNSADASSSSTWTTVSVLTSGEAMTSILNKVSAMFKNIRYLYGKIGSTNISGSGRSTITSAIGNTNISTAGDGTLTGAVSALDTGLNGLFSINNMSAGSVYQNRLDNAQLFYYNLGNMCFVHGVFRLAVAGWAGMAVATGFPTPTYNANVPIQAINTSTPSSVQCYVNTNGSICIVDALAQYTWITFFGYYRRNV